MPNESGEHAVDLDAVVFGGGVAGLWALDELVRRGHEALLLEAGELGAGQTIASQGILHGGLKYSLGGLLTASASAVREMPDRWRRSLAGEAEPDLSGVRVRARFCHLWRTGSLSSRFAMLGARLGLRVTPVILDPAERPDALAAIEGQVARLDEEVIDTGSLLQRLCERHRARIMQIDFESGLEVERDEPGEIRLVRLIDPQIGAPLDLRPRAVILCAGTGNAALRERAGLDAGAMQRRPLHMVMARGPLPDVNGHCVDRSTTRVTITSAEDSSGRTVWQIGGQLAEDGVTLERDALVMRAVAELDAVLPRLDLDDVEWATYRVDRAEPAAGGRRPDEPSATREGNTITAWPTKLVLAPRLAEMIAEHLAPPRVTERAASAVHALDAWPQPVVALPPWETETSWSTVPSAKPI